MADLDAFIFGVDLDGVCADYTLGLQGSVSAHTGRPRTDFPIERDWDFTQWGFGSGEFEYHHRRAVATERMFRTHEPNAGDSFIHDKRPQARARAAQRSLHPVSRATCLAAGVAA